MSGWSSSAGRHVGNRGDDDEDGSQEDVRSAAIPVLIVARLAGRWIHLLGGSLTGGKGVDPRGWFSGSCAVGPRSH